VLPARSIDEFLAAPRDRYIARRNFCYWQIGTRYKGCIVWGRPNEQDAREMIRTFETGVRLDEIHASMADMRDLASIDVMGFAVIMRYMAERQPIFVKTIRRQAILHGSGVVGAAVAGFYRVVRPSYPTAECSDAPMASPPGFGALASSKPRMTKAPTRQALHK
jgi:hypothetical protein